MKHLIKALFKKILPKKMRKQVTVFRYRNLLRVLADPIAKRRVLFFCAPDYSNLGDHVIALAQDKFFCDYFREYERVEVPFCSYDILAKHIKKRIQNECLIIICGGGYLGSLWPIGEGMVQNIIKTYTDNRIIIFPQTLFIAKGEEDRLLPEIRSVWGGHKNLSVCFRNKSSFDYMLTNGLYKDNIYYIPDISLYLDNAQRNYTRNGVLFIFRSDCEKTLPDKSLNLLSGYFEERGEQIRYSDMISEKQSITQTERYTQVEMKLDEFRSAKLVITDRLHGMIFAAITGTPCIAFNNISRKIEGVYDEWIKYLDYIAFTHSAEEAIPQIERLMSLESVPRYDNAPLKKYYDMLAEIVRGNG